MKREDLLEKGFSQEQITDILNMWHNNNSKKEQDLQSQIDDLKGFEAKYNQAQKQLDDIKKANMSDQQKLEEALKDAEAKQKMANKIYHTAKAKEILAGYNLDDSLIERLVTDDEVSTIANANLFKQTLDNRDESITKKVQSELTKVDVKPTPTNVPTGTDIMTKEKFTKMSMSEQKIWKDANIEQYRSWYPSN